MSYRWRWVALFVILAAEVMDMLDALITNIAAPTLRHSLGGSTSLMQWVGAAYTMAMAFGLITGGRLGDLYGRKRMFLVGAAGFSAGSALCALSRNPEMLIGSRVVQGLFGAVMLPQGLGMIKEMFTSDKEQAAAFGAFGPVMGLSSVGGPIVAGWLIDANYWGTGWRMIFLINLPLGLFAALGGLRFLPESRTANANRLDIGGALIAGAAALMLIYPLVQGRELGWPAWSFALMACSALVFALFAYHQVLRRRHGRDTLIMPGLFRKRGFTGGLLVGLAFFAALSGFSLVFSLYVQIGLHYSPLKAGLSGIPLSFGMVLGFGAEPLLKLGRTLIQIGALITCAGVGGMILTMHLAGPGVTPWQFIPALAVTGIGMSLVMGPFFDTVLGTVDQHETGSASGTLNAVQQLGSSLGVALLGTVFFDVLPHHGMQDAMRTTLWVVGALALAAAALNFLLPRRTVAVPAPGVAPDSTPVTSSSK